MRFILVIVALFALAVPAFAQQAAQEAAPASTSDADIDTLIKIIENDQSRAALIERLQQSASAEPAVPAEAPADLSIARQLAEYTRSVAEGASSTFAAVGQVFADLQQGFSGAANGDLNALRDVAVGVLLVGAGLFGSFLLLRVLVVWLQGLIASRVVNRAWYVRLLGAVGAAAIDGGSVILAWAIGYVLALSVIGGTAGRMGINQSLLLNAFLVVEMSKLVVRAVLVPRHTALRLLPVSDSNAAYWSFWLARVISLVFYTFMFVSPVIAANLSPGAASAVQALVMLTAVVIGIIIVLQNKRDVRHWLNELAQKREKDGLGQLFMLVGQFWHLVAIAYLLALLVVWFANPERALPFMIGATIQSLIAIVAGAVIVGFIGRFVGVGLRLPGDIKARLPLLEARLHAFVPRVMLVVRWVVIAGVVAAILQAWSLFDFVGWISSEQGQQIAGSVVSAALIVLVCAVLYVVVASWVEYRLNTTIGKVPTPREKTLLNLFKNAFTIALVVFGLMLALAQIGVNIAPLLAGAGVIGLAIGFGAQKLVQDIITGIFIQFENVMNEGDVVEAGGKSGVVEKLTIRSVTIRDLSGTVHLIPFSSVDQVSNMVRGFSFHVAEIGVAYDSDIAEVKAAMQEAFEMLLETAHKEAILDDLDMQGIIGFGDSAVTVRARIKTLPGQHWAAGRAYSEFVKQVFARRGIEIPYPHVTYVQGGQARASGRTLGPPADDAGKPADGPLTEL
ncbi:Potassium efflux system KefA protein / small-conductance mechanosensitive channel [Devosia sp. LC5]|uniref:mechanosensitive ion channel domain-containing protein n=1 Tax=Devosia sp. LC5 TaxID=1502724 RepID=UPI0004E46C92|nr:mechanosensitive ion channel domain-containing protein [Devosia sp. LC5]KFC61999.1 Potassium efflux system KefA protein / small-conductance mechanosensitive channel [Devosia sp. LC5]